MLDPCANCKACKALHLSGVPRKVDCLAPYPNLRTIGNSAEGFKGAVSTSKWSLTERDFYDKQVIANRKLGVLPDIL